MVEYHVVEEEKQHGEIVPRGLILFLLTKTRRMGRRKVSEEFSEYPYLIMSMKQWNGYWDNKL